MNNWGLIAGLTVTTAAVKAAGPIALGGRVLPNWFNVVIRSIAPALLAALVVTSALANGEDLAVGADTAGVALGGVFLLRGASVIVAVVVAAVATAGLRQL